MKKRFIGILSASLIAFYGIGLSVVPELQKSNADIFLTAYAEEVKNDTNFKIVVSEGENKNITITGIKDAKAVKEEMIIPSEIDGVAVTAIADNAFQYNSKIKKVVIAESVKSIGYAAFAECAALADVTIPSGVTDVCEASFHNTPWLAALCSESDFVTAGDHILIKYCGEAEKPELPDDIIRIGREAFYNNSYVKEIVIPAGVKYINEYAFADCALLEKVQLCAELEEIQNFAFWNCFKLKGVAIPENVKKIGIMSFGYYIDTVSKYTGPVTGFKITGYESSTAEWYAGDNAFIFKVYDDKYDINHDCTIDGRDISNLKEIIFSSENTKAADLNQDGKTDVFDLIRTKRMMVGN